LAYLFDFFQLIQLYTDFGSVVYKLWIGAWKCPRCMLIFNFNFALLVKEIVFSANVTQLCARLTLSLGHSYETGLVWWVDLVFDHGSNHKNHKNSGVQFSLSNLDDLSG